MKFFEVEIDGSMHATYKDADDHMKKWGGMKKEERKLYIKEIEIDREQIY